jgi:hypothetical protein
MFLARITQVRIVRRMTILSERNCLRSRVVRKIKKHLVPKR